MSTSRNIYQSLAQLQKLNALDHIGTPQSKHKSQPGPSYQPYAVTQHIKHKKNFEEITKRELVEYRDALQGFKSAYQEEAQVHYSAQHPIYVEYVNILKKLQKIWTLAGKLDSFIQTNTVDQAKDIQKTCISILKDRELSDYAPLFKPSKYFDNYGRQLEPKYGIWTYNGKVYQMETVITNLQDIMQWFIEKLS